MNLTDIISMAIHPQCHIIAVLGGKGGVGKSIFAANLTCAILAELRTPVLLIDADHKSIGDQNVITGLKPLKTLKDLALSQASLSSQPLNALVTPHNSGFSYIGAVRGPEENLNVSPDNMSKILEFMSRTYKYIVIDIGNDLQPLQMQILQEATVAVCVTSPEILVLTQTQKLINELLSATLPKDMIQIVINKMSNQGISAQTVATQLQILPLAAIPVDESSHLQALQRLTPIFLLNPKSPIASSYIEVTRKLTGGILQKLKSLTRSKITVAPSATVDSSTPAGSLSGSTSDPRTLLKIRIHNELIRTVDLKKLLVDGKIDESKEKEVREKVKKEITLIVDRENPDLPREERSKIIKEVLEEALGLGPLEDLLADVQVSEIMVNGHKRIFIEKSGKVQLSPVTFTSNDHLRRIIERIVTPLGRQINDSVPYVDARLKDGSRVNAVIEPLAIDGPALTIRKFKKGGISPDKYIEFGSITKSMIDFLRICTENGINIVISGGTGSGKTSLLNMLSSFIPANERIITVEDAAELQMQQEHVVRLETRPPSMEGSNAITIRDLIRNALRMRPDRIIVGECRDGAALDMLQAMNTGHDGSMTTTHANSPRECIARLETLCLMAGMDLPVRAIREQIAGAVHLIVQISRLSDGSRKVLSITEVAGLQGEVVTLAEVFKFKETGYDKNRKILGQFQATGTIPSFIQKLSDKGVVIPREIFSNDQKISTPNASGATASAATASMQNTNPFKKTGS